MALAGGPGDRRLQAIGAGGKSGHRSSGRKAAGFMGDAPGNARGPVGCRCNGRRYTGYGQRHREYTAGRAQPGDIAQENLRDVFATHARQGKGEKVG